jgi:tetratricopeptide (TPR) repeat protein
MKQAQDNQDPDAFQRAVDLLDMAIFCAPAHSRVRMERYEVEQQRLDAVKACTQDKLTRRLIVQAMARVPSSLAGMNQIPAGMLAEDALQPFLVQASLAEGLRKAHQQAWNMQGHHLRMARNNCPVLWKPHLAIAEHVPPDNARLAEGDRLLYWKQCDTLTAYLDRIKLLQPHRAETWYLAGELEWMNGQREAAIASWRRSLELSDEFISQIALRSHLAPLQPEMKLSRDEIITRLLPADSASQLVRVAWVLHPEMKEVEQRKPYMERALQLLEKNPDVLSPENQYVYGMALWGVDRREQGLQNLLIAVRARPLQTDWRLSLGRLYFELEKYSDAREQLQMALRQQPGNAIAELLLKKLDELQRPATSPAEKK